MPAGSAYGKVILLGEHAVVYGYPALCGALSKKVTIEAVPGTGRLVLPVLGVSTPPLEELFTSHHQFAHPEQRICQAYATLGRELLNLGKFSHIPFDWIATFDIPLGAGLGASAALSVALVRAFDHTLKLALTPAQILQAAQAAEHVFHGNASGLDAYLAQSGGFGLFRRNGGFTQISIQPFSICVGLTGRPKDTRARVARIAELLKSHSAATQQSLAHIADLVELGTKALQAGRFSDLGNVMNQNQEELQKLEASSPEIELLCRIAIDAGALGAKLTGGGGGGCVLALAPGKEEKILSVWQHAGFSSFLASLGTPSSCIDEEYEGEGRSSST